MLCRRPIIRAVATSDRHALIPTRVGIVNSSPRATGGVGHGSRHATCSQPVKSAMHINPYDPERQARIPIVMAA